MGKADEILKTGIYNIDSIYIIDFNKLDYNKSDYGINIINRTHLFHIHKMSYIDILVEYDKSHIGNNGLEFVFKFLQPWWNVFKNKINDNAAWHDHATALRGQNLVNLYNHIININYMDISRVNLLKDILLFHKNILLDNEFYSEFTNHGLDQSLALYQIACLFKDNNSINIAKNRIQNEINHVFCEDGGHKENSPAYLNYGLKQLLNVFDVIKQNSFDNNGIGFSNKILDRAILALGFFALPNRMLPLIGDTRDFIVKDIFGSRFESSIYYLNFLYSISLGKNGIKPSNKDLLLPISGYAIFRETWEKANLPKSLHIVFKSGYLSQYHRQDDDLNITLFYDGEEWLIDGGEYKHDNKDPYRIYFRSADSHNITRPRYCAICRSIDEIKNYGDSKIYDYYTDGETSIINGVSYIFKGYKNIRKLTYDRRKHLIELHDVCVPVNMSDKLDEFITRFHIPIDKAINVDNTNNTIKIIGKNRTMNLSSPNFKGSIRVIKGKQEPRPLGWRSRKSAVLEKCYTIEFYHEKSQSLDQVFLIHFT